MYMVKTNKGHIFDIVVNSGNEMVDKEIAKGLAINYYIKDKTEIITAVIKKEGIRSE